MRKSCSQGVGAVVSHGVGAVVCQSVGAVVSQGVGAVVSQGVGAVMSQGVGAVVSQGVGRVVSQGVGAVVSQGVGAVLPKMRSRQSSAVVCNFEKGLLLASQCSQESFTQLYAGVESKLVSPACYILQSCLAESSAKTH